MKIICKWFLFLEQDPHGEQTLVPKKVLVSHLKVWPPSETGVTRVIGRPLYGRYILALTSEW